MRPTHPFRILSLDGGGTWALIQVKALMAVYPDALTGHDVLGHFDLAIANSGGSIVLAALAADKSLSEILQMFLDEQARRSMFTDLLLGPALKRFGLGPRYDTKAKLCGLRKALGRAADMPMRDWRLENAAGREVRLILCGFDYDRVREVFFRTHPGPPDAGPRDHQAPLPRQMAVIEATFAEAVHASTNAPVRYFDAPATSGAERARFWDGAMGGYNNPVLAGVVEAVCDGRLERSNVAALSLGTGSVVLPDAGSVSDHGLLLPKRAGGLLDDTITAGMCILDDPPDAASYVAHVLLGGHSSTRPSEPVVDGPVVRMSPLVQPVPGRGVDWTTPTGLSIADFRALTDTDMDAVAQAEVERIALLADLWTTEPADDRTVRNQPIRSSRWLQVEIGHATFVEAKARWLR